MAFETSNSEKIEVQPTLPLKETLMVTGSNHFILSGSITDGYVQFHPQIEDVENRGTSLSMKGPFLAVINTYNHNLYSTLDLESEEGNEGFQTSSTIDLDEGSNEGVGGLAMSSSTSPLAPGIIGIFTDRISIGVTPSLDPTNLNHYIRWSAKESNLPQYKETLEPLMIQKGDEIRVHYNTVDEFPRSVTQDFVVLRVMKSEMLEKSKDPNNKFDFIYGDKIYKGGEYKISNLYNKIEVHPNPETLDIKIPGGRVYALTIRRRKETDTKVTLNSHYTSPTGGYNSPTKGGFLVPQNMSPTQKDNVLKLIENTGDNRLSIREVKTE